MEYGQIRHYFGLLYTLTSTRKLSFFSAVKKTPENREWVSIVETVSAVGAYIRCLVILRAKMYELHGLRMKRFPIGSMLALIMG